MKPAISNMHAILAEEQGDKTALSSLLSVQSQWRLYIASLIANDLIMLVLAFKTAYYARFRMTIPVFHLEVEPSEPYYLALIMTLAPMWLIVFAVLGLYSRNLLLGGPDEYARVFRATSIGLLLIVVAGFLQPTFIIARGWLLLAWLLAFIFTSLGRFLLRRGVYFLRRHGMFCSRAIIIGANDEGISLARQLLSWKTSGLKLVGFVDKKFHPGTTVTGNLRVLGNIDQLDEVIKVNEIKELIFASSAISSRDSMLDVFKKYGVSNGINVRMSSGLYEIITTGLTVKEFAYVPLVGINKVRLTGFDRFLKFVLDYGITIPGLIFLSPFLLLIAIAVKMDSPGPIIYRRRVMGVNGKVFDAFKFRTMHVNGDDVLAAHPELKEELARNHKLKQDPRVTRVGRFLRKLSLDELPQLFNVLRHEMAIVGPRMISPEEMSQYSQWGINLLTVRPGITGLWQVSGRSDVSYEERVRLDMYYIRNWTIWLDLQLLWRTIPAVLKGKGAY